MAINFPASPSTNDTHTENAITWIFNGTSWDSQGEQVTAASIGLGSVDNTSDADKPISTAQQTALDDKQPATIPLDASFVFVGDSITAGTGGQTDTAWSTTIQTLSNFAGRGAFTNKAVSGDKLADMAGDYATQVEPLKPGAGDTAYLLGMIGINDVAGGVLTTATISSWFADLEAYWTTAIADGFRVAWITPTSRDGQDVVINQISELILGSSLPDIIIDAGQILPDARDARYYLGDKLHLTTLGGKVLAEAVNNQMSSGKGRDKVAPTRILRDGTWIGDKAKIETSTGRLWLGGDFQNGGAALVHLNGNEAIFRFSLTTNEQKTSLLYGLVPTSGAIALGSAIGDGVMVAPSARSMSFAVANLSTDTQAIRWKIENTGIWRASAVTSPTDYTQSNSAQFGLAFANGNHVIGAMQDDFVMVAPAGSSIIFGTSTTGTQNTRVRIKADGAVKLNEGPEIHTGSGTPESVVTASIGSTYHRTDGGAGTSFYVKESGSGNTGWIGK